MAAVFRIPAHPICVCFWLVCVSACGADLSAVSGWISRDWQVDSGLPDNAVTGVAQTADGFLWIGNPGGIARFDGVRFDSFSTQQLLGESTGRRLRRLLGGDKDALWLALDHSVVVRLQAGRTEVFTNDLPDEVVHSLTEDAEGALWICYRQGMVCRLKDGRVTRFTEPDQLPSGSIATLATDRKRQLWFAKGGSVGRFHDGEFKTQLQFEPGVVRLAPALSGGLWICAGFELHRLDENNTLHKCGDIQPSNTRGGTTALLEDRAGLVWIGTSASGLFCYDGKSFEMIPTSDLQISSLIEDREGNIWAGTGGGGLNRLRPRAVILHGRETGWPAAVQSVCETPAGEIWLTTQNGALWRQTTGGWTNVSAGADWPGGVATCVASGPAGEVWIGTVGRSPDGPKLYCWKDGRFTVLGQRDRLRPRTVHALLVSRNGDLWIGGEAPDIVQRFREGTFKEFKVPAGTRHIIAIAEDLKGDIWVGALQGVLLRITGDEVVNETRPAATKGIRGLHVTPDGALWIAYGGCGVGRLKEGRLALINAERGFHWDTVSQVIPDGRGSLWFGSDRGIFKVSQEQLDAVAEGRSNRVQPVHYGNAHGLPALQARSGESPVVLRSQDGRLWMPMRTALAVISPDKFRDDLDPPSVWLTRVIADDQLLASYGGTIPVRKAADLRHPTAALRVPPAHRRLAFDFTALHFGAPENTQFRYRLKGLETDWIDSESRRTVSYSRLPAGDYQFEVKACNSDGVWNERGAVIGIVVTPFFWQTWWFRIGTLAGFTLAMIVAVRYISYRRLRVRLQSLEQEAALDKERRRIARDIHDDLGGSLTQIAMLSDLALEDRAAPEKSAEHVGQISTRAREGIRSLDEIIWAVNPSNDTLQHLVDYIGQFAVGFLGASRIRCFVDLPEEMPDRNISSEVRHHLFLVVKETLTNIVRHARASEVWVRTVVTADSLQISIEDNGQGFAGAPSDADADGLRNMTERMREIGGEFHIETRTGSGTRVLLRLGGME